MGTYSFALVVLLGLGRALLLLRLALLEKSLGDQDVLLSGDRAVEKKSEPKLTMACGPRREVHQM